MGGRSLSCVASQPFANSHFQRRGSAFLLLAQAASPPSSCFHWIWCGGRCKWWASRSGLQGSNYFSWGRCSTTFLEGHVQVSFFSTVAWLLAAPGPKRRRAQAIELLSRAQQVPKCTKSPISHHQKTLKQPQHILFMPTRYPPKTTHKHALAQIQARPQQGPVLC